MGLLRSRKGRGRRRLSRGWMGLLAALLILVVCSFAFTRFNPFQSQFMLDAVFRTANNLQTGSPVRVAGVDVGTVSQVQGLPGGGARVALKLKDDALPIHSDAELKIRPRIFLEGNYFIDLKPGSPSAPKVKSGFTVPVNQTATPVQFGQLLATLQYDTRTSLQTLIKEYAERGLGNGGAQAYNQGLDFAPGAEQYSSVANEATLGERPHDLSFLLRGQQRLFRSLSANPQTLEDLVTQLNVSFNAFAREDVPLEQAIPALRDTLRVGVPALRALDNALPSVRTFARAALPGTISSGPEIDAALPTVHQLRLLIRPQELEGLVRDLRPTIPALARLNHESIPFMGEQRTLSACQNDFLLPFSTEPIPNPDFPGENGRPFYKVAPQGLVGLSGESRLSDANTPLFHVQVQTGNTTVITQSQGQTFFSQAPSPPEGSRPAVPNERPPFRPGIPCEIQQVPDLNAPGGPAGASVTQPITSGLGGLLPLPPGIPILMSKNEPSSQVLFAELQDYMKRVAGHKPAVNPYNTPQPEYLKQMRKLGLGVTPAGKVYSLGGTP